MMSLSICLLYTYTTAWGIAPIGWAALKTPCSVKIWLNWCVGNGNEKSVGVVSSALIPEFRPSHCPQIRISNASQPTPREYIHTWTTHRPSPTGGEKHGLFQGYNPLRWRSPLHYLCIWLSLRSLTTQSVTLENAFSRPALQMALWPHSSICFFVGRIPQEGCLYTSSVAKLQFFSETNKKKA